MQAGMYWSVVPEYRMLLASGSPKLCSFSWLIYAYIFTAPKILENRELYKAASVPMSSDCDTGCYVTWIFPHILHTSLDTRASRPLASDSFDPYDVVKQLFRFRIMTNKLPHQATFIQLRVPRTILEACVSSARAQTRLPDLPFEGYI